MSKQDHDEFRQHAAECQRMADATNNPADKVRWLSLAQSWLNMLTKTKAHATSPDTFAAEEAGRGTGQKVSRRQQ
jgi:hypothetical protein